jgi:putative transposase
VDTTEFRRDVGDATSRTDVSNDNPYSEAQFKTLKYRPDFPERFGSIEYARTAPTFCEGKAFGRDHPPIFIMGQGACHFALGA